MSSSKSQSLFHAGLRVLARMMLTLVIIAGALFTGIFGHQALSSRAAQDDDRVAAPLTTVAALPITMREGFTVERRFSGQFEAQQETRLAFEEGGTVTEILVREGDVVETGMIVAQLDTRLLDAERDRLQAMIRSMDAQVELARRTNERQEALRSAGHASEARLDDSSLTLNRLEASRAELDAALRSVEVRLSKSELRAPFAGIIADRLLDVGSVTSGGVPVLTLLEDGPSRFRVGLDPQLAPDLLEDGVAQIETAVGIFDATLSSRTPELDAATRAQVVTFDVEADVPARTTGEIVLSDSIDARGAWLPLRALRQGPRGTWTVLTVEENEASASIGVEAVEIIHVGEGQVFARGTFVDGTLFLPDGTHRVVPGELVALVGTPNGISGDTLADVGAR
ncbi:MAG: efflux RND transporter periplasmic adaptor subunit [Pseudomonadota bacterium]